MTGKQKAKFSFSKDFNRVEIAQFSPDGSPLATCCSLSIYLWDVKTGQQKAKLDGRNITSVCFSPDAATLASGSWDKSIRLWDVKSGQQRAKLDGHSDNVTSICFSPDGSTLASGSWDKSICLWDVKTSKEITQTENRFQELEHQLSEKNLNILKQYSCITNTMVQRIALQYEIQVHQALILKGEYVNYKGVDLFPLMLKRGGVDVESLLKRHDQF